MMGMLARVYINRKLANLTPEYYRELLKTLRLGVDVVEWGVENSELPDDGVCYIGFFPDQLPPNARNFALPLVGENLFALNSLILNFCLGYIPTEIAAFRGAQEDIVSRQRILP